MKHGGLKALQGLWLQLAEVPRAAKLCFVAVVLCLSWAALQYELLAAATPAPLVELGDLAPVGGDAAPIGGSEEATLRWLFEGLVTIGPVRMGLPGLAALCIFVTPALESMPRIRRDRDVGKLPLLPFSSMATNSVIWFTYGTLGGIPGVYCPNICGISFGLYYSAVYCSYCPAGADWLPSTRGAHATVALCAVLFCLAASQLLTVASAMQALGLVGNAGNIILFSGPLSAIKTVLKEQSTQSLPFGFTCIVTVNCILWSYYGFVIMNDPQIYASNFVGLMVAAIQLTLFAHFGVQSPPAPADGRDVPKDVELAKLQGLD